MLTPSWTHGYVLESEHLGKKALIKNNREGLSHLMLPYIAVWRMKENVGF